MLGADTAVKYFNKGKHLLQTKKLEDALQCFSMAIEQDPQFAEAYQHRGFVLSKLGRMDEARADHEKMKSLQPAGQPDEETQPTESPKTEEEYDDLIEDLTPSDTSSSPHMAHVDNIYDELMADPDEDEFDFDDEVYDYAFSDDTIESDDLLESLVSGDTEDHKGIAAIIEFLNGEREEVPWTYLFEPTEDELTLVHEQDSDGEIVSLDDVVCIRLAKPPTGMPLNPDDNCHVEVIETIDGNIYHENIHGNQQLPKVLYGYSTKGDTKFKYTLLPLVNVKKRFQRRHLGQILVAKNLITDQQLKNALAEHNELKKIKFGQVLAEQANLLKSAVEAEIQKAYSETTGSYKVGEILRNAGLVSDEQVEQALAYQKKLHNRKLGHFLIEKGVVKEKDLYLALAEKFRIPFADLREQKGSKKALSLLPKELIKKLNVLPLSIEGDTMLVATMLPDPNPICEVILRHSPVHNLSFVLVQPSHLRNVLRMIFQEKQS